jgi:hypothetical protein
MEGLTFGSDRGAGRPPGPPARAYILVVRVLGRAPSAGRVGLGMDTARAARATLSGYILPAGRIAARRSQPAAQVWARRRQRAGNRRLRPDLHTPRLAHFFWQVSGSGCCCCRVSTLVERGRDPPLAVDDVVVVVFLS